MQHVSPKPKILPAKCQIMEMDSNFELLRLLCIFGIITMHTFGAYINNATGFGLLYGVSIVSLFNTGVSIFMLISGFYGINFSAQKIISMWLNVLFYSVLSTALSSLGRNGFSTNDLLGTFFPVSTNRFWYITTYFILLLFCDYINKVPEKLSRRDFKSFLMLMFVVLCVIPTIVQINILNDSGKGPANMLLLYLLGRYIRKYHPQGYPKNRMILIAVCILATEFILNRVLTLFLEGPGVYAPFARDSSVFIVTGSIAIFMTFKEIHIPSRLVNKLAQHVLAIYLFEGAVRIFLNQFFDLSPYTARWYLFAIIAIYVIIVMGICVIVDRLRFLLLSRTNDHIVALAISSYQKIENTAWFKKFASFLSNL